MAKLWALCHESIFAPLSWIHEVAWVCQADQFILHTVPAADKSFTVFNKKIKFWKEYGLDSKLLTILILKFSVKS